MANKLLTPKDLAKNSYDWAIKYSKKRPKDRKMIFEVARIGTMGYFGERAAKEFDKLVKSAKD